MVPIGANACSIDGRPALWHPELQESSDAALAPWTRHTPLRSTVGHRAGMVGCW